MSYHSSKEHLHCPDCISNVPTLTILDRSPVVEVNALVVTNVAVCGLPILMRLVRLFWSWNHELKLKLAANYRRFEEPSSGPVHENFT